jgi:tRNA threonylcarbamoyladenosine biosynthesis protein TsaE
VTLREPPAAPPSVRRTDSAEETERLGAGLAPALRAGDVVVLSGPLGSGKTRFATGVAAGLGARGRVRSPSFTLVHEHGGDPPLAHVDLYRLEAAEAERLGLDELREQAVLVVEWGERLPERLGRDALLLSFEILGPGARAITARARGPRGQALLAAWRRLAEGAASGSAR